MDFEWQLTDSGGEYQSTARGGSGDLVLIRALEIETSHRRTNMPFDYSQIWSAWDPWAGIPAEYNLGDALTAGQVRAGRGEVPALLWENAAGSTRLFTYRQL